MSKVICDVCGTSYPETADQCPICGCVRSANMQGVLQDADNSEHKSGYTYVKGGRFSKANVKKRNRSVPIPVEEPEFVQEQEENAKSSTNKGLLITALVLLLAIVAVMVYITVRFLTPSDVKPQKEPEQTVTETQEQEEKEISCTNIVPVKKEIILDGLHDGFLLEYGVEPADTTDVISVKSSDETVIAVEEKGNNTCFITAVAPGEAYVIFECGEIKVQCKVKCNFEMPTEDTTEMIEETTEDTTEPEYTEEDILYNTRYVGADGTPEVTLRYIGEEWRCYKGNIPLEEITWKSDNESVATVENGVVKAVGSGDTLIHAMWGELDVVCKVRCLGSSEGGGISGSGGNIGEG